MLSLLPASASFAASGEEGERARSLLSGPDSATPSGARRAYDTSRREAAFEYVSAGGRGSIRWLTSFLYALKGLLGSKSDEFHRSSPSLRVNVLIHARAGERVIQLGVSLRSAALAQVNTGGPSREPGLPDPRSWGSVPATARSRNTYRPAGRLDLFLREPGRVRTNTSRIGRLDVLVREPGHSRNNYITCQG